MKIEFQAFSALTKKVSLDIPQPTDYCPSFVNYFIICWDQNDQIKNLKSCDSTDFRHLIINTDV